MVNSNFTHFHEFIVFLLVSEIWCQLFKTEKPIRGDTPVYNDKVINNMAFTPSAMCCILKITFVQVNNSSLHGCVVSRMNSYIWLILWMKHSNLEIGKYLNFHYCFTVTLGEGRGMCVLAWGGHQFLSMSEEEQEVDGGSVASFFLRIFPEPSLNILICQVLILLYIQVVLVIACLSWTW